MFLCPLCGISVDNFFNLKISIFMIVFLLNLFFKIFFNSFRSFGAAVRLSMNPLARPSKWKQRKSICCSGFVFVTLTYLSNFLMKSSTSTFPSPRTFSSLNPVAIIVVSSSSPDGTTVSVDTVGWICLVL